MFKVFFVCVFSLAIHGCASGSNNPSVSIKETEVKEEVNKERLTKYANNMGCKMLKSGYMICPKSMNR